MASVVFLRGVNVGGHKTFQPSALVKELSHLDAVNVGAAGTFVIRKSIDQKALRSEFLKRLPFEPELMICRGNDILDLASAELFPNERSYKNARRFVTIMANQLRDPPVLPISQPDNAQWQVRVVAVSGRFALSFWRRMGPRLIYPNEVVEKNFKVRATTRNWETIEKICEILGRC
jgi:uncharacterized protein (DUF1697 family)